MFTLTRKLSFVMIIMNIIAILIFVATSYMMMHLLLLGQSSNSNNSIADPISINSPPPQPYEYHHEESSYFWEQNESNCIHIDNICIVYGMLIEQLLVSGSTILLLHSGIIILNIINRVNKTCTKTW